MAAPVVAVTGAMAVAPGLMTAPQVPQVHQAHQALAHTGPRTITAQFDAVVRPAARTYTVQAGDTLYEIALRYYGLGKYWSGLYWANRSKISHPDLIYAGQVLTIPSLQEVATAPDPSTWDRSRWDRSTTNPSTTNPSSTDLSSAAPTKTSQGSTSTQSSQGSAGTQSSQGSAGTQSSPAGSSTVQSDIANGNSLLALGQYLVDNGYSKVAAAGIASCVDGESGGNPESVGSGGGGLIGWTPLGSAAPNANIVTGNASQDMMTQLADILYYNSNEIGQSQVAALNSQADPVSAADFYSQNFEKPAVTNSDVVPSVAEQVFSELGG
ncbi:MAG: LysM peptidoglycan-binding protein [Actinomycetia bacterium]|nr:LysM peptidoglycan-binding protein [Actinomycetes bacterium]